MLTRSLLTSALASTLIAFSLAACSDGASTRDIGDDALAEGSESELTADSFVATWTNPSAQAKDFGSLTLKAGGAYEASIVLCPPAPGGVTCRALPIVESGRFSILRGSSNQTLRLVPDGASVRRYQIAFVAPVPVGAPRAIELSRLGKSQILAEAKSGGYVPCEGKKTGDTCTICAPFDVNCFETQEVKACNASGVCVSETSPLPLPYNPCAGKKTGDTCKICAPFDANCFETQEVKACNASGACVSETSPLPLPYSPCAGKNPGDTCRLCDPANIDCFETAVLKACDGGGVCR